MRKHILVISQYFYPEAFRINDICMEWVKRGYEVTVLTGIPNYPEGEFYDGYGYIHKRTEEWNGIKILRIPLVARGHSSIMLMLNYVSFVMSGYLWKVFSKVKADYVFTFEVSPMTQALIGCWYAKKHKIPHFLYVQDLWPENVETVTGIRSPILIKPIEKMVEYIYKNSNHIFATSPSFVKEIQKRCSDRDRVSYWPQYAEDFYQPIERKIAISKVLEISADDSFKIIFTGNIGQAQGLEILPKVAKRLKEQNQYVKFIIVGDGRNKEDFEKQISEVDVKEMFSLIGRQPAERIPYMLGCCDAAFISFMNDELFEKTIPAKLQSYMACGMPIVASASGETERIIKEAACGVSSPIGDAESLAAAIKKMLFLSNKELEKMGKNSWMYYEKNFEKDKLMNEIQTYFM